MRQIKKIKKSFAMVTTIYFAVIAIICYIAHTWAFSYAADFRGTTHAIGSEILIVPMILVGSYFVFKYVIYNHFDCKLDAFESAYRIAKSSKVRCGVLVMNSASIDKVYGKYISDGNGHVVFRRNKYDYQN